jgi:hypothetical protein
MIGSIFKAAMVVVDAPVAIIKDVVTLGGVLNDEKTRPDDGTYTGDALKRFTNNVEDITK